MRYHILGIVVNNAADFSAFSAELFIHFINSDYFYVQVKEVGMFSYYLASTHLV